MSSTFHNHPDESDMPSFSQPPPVDVTFEDIEGPVVYHKNPVGDNGIFGKKQGKIVGYMNQSKKRAIVVWEDGSKSRPNSTSLCSSPSKKKKRKTSKKRKRIVVATVVRKKLILTTTQVFRTIVVLNRVIIPTCRRRPQLLRLRFRLRFRRQKTKLMIRGMTCFTFRVHLRNHLVNNEFLGSLWH